ncbi:hypothetical protein C0J52_09211 [Blattella germanica]|nr:hypothetical protein C0J52_09211 [Blattella germanica]
MENPEEVLQSLDEFAKLKPKDIPRELEDYLSYVAKTGDPIYQWSIVKCLFREKLLNVITDFYETSPTIDLPPCPNVDPFNYETMKNSLLERLDSFPSAPFTVQRLCELLTTPRKEYSRADKFMRAVEKNILVVSTREPGNVRRSDNNGQSELLMNGVMDGRGIELGEAIETVSSDGVNMMHANESEVNVTENENVVPVECGGMEEIDMEEQGESADNMEATNSNTWDKEQSEGPQSETVVQNEESGDTKSYEKDEEGKSKEESNIVVETSNIENAETNSTELPSDTENVGSTEVIPETPDLESDTSSSENKPDVDATSEGAEAEADTGAEAEAESESEVTVEANASTSEASEEIREEKPSKEHTSISEEKDAVDSSSTNEEDLSKHVSSTDEMTADGNANDDTVADNVIPEASSSVVPNTSETVAEVVTSSVEDVTETESSTSDIQSIEETCEKSEESGVSVDSATSETIVSQEISSSEEVPVATSEVEKVEETDIVKPLVCDEVETNSADEPKQDTEQDEAMDVDENVPSADTDEPMDQSEQPVKAES